MLADYTGIEKVTRHDDPRGTQLAVSFPRLILAYERTVTSISGGRPKIVGGGLTSAVTAVPAAGCCFDMVLRARRVDNLAGGMLG